jgi:enoyl-CoA hydratase/carnithine racemase
MSYETTLIEKRDQTDIITLNRPKKFNTFSTEMAEELNTTLRQLDEDVEV